jgi:hypothetical protein
LDTLPKAVDFPLGNKPLSINILALNPTPLAPLPPDCAAFADQVEPKAVFNASNPNLTIRATQRFIHASMRFELRSDLWGSARFALEPWLIFVRTSIRDLCSFRVSALHEYFRAWKQKPVVEGGTKPIYVLRRPAMHHCQNQRPQ